MRSFHLPGRSPVYATNAMCATSHPLATACALSVLRSGGNAVDAAIAAAGVLAVIEPAMTGIGGDCFAMVAEPNGKISALNATGKAPAGATLEFFQSNGIRELTTSSPHAVTVPGAIDGWTALLDRFGSRPLGDLLEPAIAQARDGFPVAPRVQWDWAQSAEKLAGHIGSREHLLFGGKAPSIGQVVRLDALAKTLEAIAHGGRSAFYEGPIAADMVHELTELGGLHTLDDFASQRCEFVEPIAADYRGLTVHELPPNNHGVVALMALKMWERIGKISDDPLSPERLHVMIEISRLTYAMRDRFVADPTFSDVPVAELISDATIDALLAKVDRKRRSPDLGPLPMTQGSDTTYLSIVDANGMAVSFINSVFKSFGSGLTTRKTGITFHNRGQGFSLEPGHPNVIAPGKRPMHTLVPAIATEDGEPVMSFGVMGGQFQPIGHVFVITNMRDYGMDAQEALDCPRAFFEGDDVMVEEGIPEPVRSALTEMGHSVKLRREPWGGGQIVQIDRTNGVLIGASDPRKDGMAAGY